MPFKTASGKLLYRIGDVIISTNSENPSKTYGGSWQLLCPGKTLVCIDTSDTDFNIIKKIGGNKYLQTHSHTGSTNNAGNHGHNGSVTGGSHDHQLPYSGDAGSALPGSGYNFPRVNETSPTHWSGYNNSHTHTLSITPTGEHMHSFTTSSVGSGNSQNLQPYMVVYMWVRTA